ncbi:MAG TPA: HAMP domain-containing sensor histidine kinase [Thermoleophilaceae bacterium]|jgi:two-component system OmpR family sensor kinase|nr:HAMP domain-containing sensor histidine kinase [Thermoleophilaceae bacterium]
MHSLRARLIAGLLALTAAGLLVAGAVTYLEQRSFLLDRVDQQAVAAAPALSHQLDDQGVRPPGGDHFGGQPDREPGGRRPQDVNLPPGTYGQRRTASGQVLGHAVIDYGQPLPAAPKIPAKLPIGKFVTVSSVKPGGPQYRVVATRDPEDSGITVVAVPLREVHDTLQRLLVVEAIVIAVVLTALGLTSFVLVRLGLRPLDRMGVVAGEIAAGRLSKRVEPATQKTEVGRLGLALNAMLERLERAFAQRQASEDRLRRFLADASHELRTPLASIRGYAELFHMGARDDPEALESSMRRIEDEARRMGVLVDDMLTLARLDEMREPTNEPVDIERLASDAVADARATAPDRTIELSADGAALVRGDPQQLRQVVGNLLRNALVHTPAGSPIEVDVGADDANVTLNVRDHGRGLPAGDPAQLFQRFWRAEGGRSRGRAGAGLGLAIVSEIVSAHGGSVDAGNAPDGGARFTVHLPRPLS